MLAAQTSANISQQKVSETLVAVANQINSLI